VKTGLRPNPNTRLRGSRMWGFNVPSADRYRSGLNSEGLGNSVWENALEWYCSCANEEGADLVVGQRPTLSHSSLKNRMYEAVVAHQTLARTIDPAGMW
jgi:hypothetical protein